MEIWKDIQGYEGKYQVSTEANVRSMNYNNTKKPGNLKPKINKLGFYEVKLSKNNKTKDFMLARLVAEAFVPGYKQGAVVVNKDGNKLKCESDNLKWVLPTEQKHLMYAKGNRKNGKSSGYKLSYHKQGYKSYSELADAYRINKKGFLQRLAKGWTLEEAIKIPISKDNKGKKPYFYNYYGKLMTLKQISKITGIDTKLINNRLNKGWNIYEAAEIMKGEK